MKNQWRSIFSKFSLTFILLAALLLAGCQTTIQAEPQAEPQDPPAEPTVEPPVEETEEPITIPAPLTEEETLTIFEEIEPMWDTIEYDPADYTDWVEIDCNTQTGEGCLLPNGCDLSTGEGCTLDDGCNFVTREGCVLPNGCNLETGEGCELFDGCNPITFEGCAILEGCDLETGLNCELPTGCNIVTGEGCELPNDCNPLTMEGCTIPYGMVPCRIPGKKLMQCGNWSTRAGKIPKKMPSGRKVITAGQNCSSAAMAETGKISQKKISPTFSINDPAVGSLSQTAAFLPLKRLSLFCAAHIKTYNTAHRLKTCG